MSHLPLIQAAAATAVETGASDIFLAEGEPARFRVHGALHMGGGEIAREELAAFWKVCGANPDEAMQHDAAWLSQNRRFRVNLHRRLGGLAAALRPVRTSPPQMQELGLPVQAVEPWLGRRSGLILVTGPTGSGKSTSIASALDWINRHRSCHVVTIEDPVEFVFQNGSSYFTQREVGIDVNSFAHGLRAALRQAPDVIFLGEIRDADSAMTALQASETGHLVVSTLHSSDVAETLDRFGNMVPAEQRESFRALFARQAVGILCQRLLPRMDGTGVALVCEYLEIAGAVREWLRLHDTPSVTDFLRREENPANRSFTRSLVEACRNGDISHETALANAISPVEFNRMLRGIS